MTGYSHGTRYVTINATKAGKESLKLECCDTADKSLGERIKDKLGFGSGCHELTFEITD